MVSRAGDDLFMTDAMCRSEAPAYKEIAATLAGRARILLELAEGRNAVTGEQPATLRNPQGAVGCDLSGPPWGSAIRQPIAWVSGRKEATGTAIDNPLPLGLCARYANGLAIPASLGPWMIWCRPFEQLPAPYVAPFSRGYIVIRAHDTTVGNITLNTRFWNPSLGENPDSVADDTQVLAMTATETTYDLNYWVNLRPGQNIIMGRFCPTGSDEDIIITSLALHQTVKRTHV